MNQEKVGNFIRKLRKEKDLTQEQLAEKLGVTDKSVSRWENGKTMPDYGILKELCDTLGITINELVTGERIAENKYQKVAEENLIELRKQIDKKRKVFIKIEIICGIIVIAMFIGNMVLNYIYGDNWDREQYSNIALTFVIITNISWFVSEIFNFSKGGAK